MSSVSTWRIVRRLVAAAGMSCLLLSACSASVSIGGGGSTDLSELEAKLVDLQESKSPDLDVGVASCPDDVELEEGSTFECTVTIEGVKAPYTVTLTDDNPEAEVGSFHIEPAKAIIDVSIVTDFIASKVNSTSDVSVECGNEAVIVGEVGDTISCTVSAGGDVQDVDMVIKDLDGTVTFAN